VPQLLELAQFVDQHGVPQVQVGRGGVEPRFDPQRPSQAQFGNQLLLDQYLFGTAFNQCQRIVYLSHNRSGPRGKARNIIVCPGN